MICLLGAVIGYLFSALSVITSSYGLLLLGRVVAGFTAGSQSIAQAAIVDISAPEHKARNLGLILFFTSLGFVFGPLIGGVLSASSIVSWFNYALPFYFAAGISLLNAVILYCFFNETFSSVAKINFRLQHAIHVFISAFKSEKIRKLSFVLLVMIFGWSGFYSVDSHLLVFVYLFVCCTFQ
jgi:DHA1 family tetracycline resistance protein-like MFS transporter